MQKRLYLLIYLARSELSRRYAGSLGGAFWTVMAPTALIGAMWVALDYGLGLRAVLGPGYGVSFVIGMVAWIAFSDSVGDAVSAIIRSPHLVKKVVFQVELLPLASTLSFFVVHLVLVILVAVALTVTGQLNLTNAWTMPLWFTMSIGMACGLGWFFSSLNVFVRDVQAIAPFLLTIWFWLTPIVWPLDKVPGSILYLVALNPMAVVVEGYRSSLTVAPFAFSGTMVMVSLTVVVALLIAGRLVFTSLRPSFADHL